ncbi:MAG: polysulfide reductase NrfD [Bacteroidales bacterium]|jgi:formate-dependent nitrite reductase membrane component NrfD|nr:polysulfide reductase NrfD [Bacteroidales bacterium]HNS30065.1 dimethyl sulfoxide reductase anchor subunit [Tenuifilaceae bacterium]MBP8642979.1 polysulfide reductase NrfD [Bacteroidales bacterium]NLI87136.1 polysulfide reductase NrfD [Bacteroidales bacterium]HOW20553.1 dimethyl sulfoxide reductase anchor subunit [Tenuifilaceae bacterium]
MWTQTPSIIENEQPADRFALHYVPQTHWRIWHAIWFWAMGIGSGIFCLRQFLGFSGGGLFWGMNAIDVIGLVLVAIGGIILILDLGKPFRFLNSLLKPKNAWISRGAISDFIFLGIGVLYVLPGLTSSLPWSDAVFSEADAFGRILIVLAIFFAFIIMIYPGFVLYYSKNIPFWNSILTPILFLEYALTSSFGLLGLMGALNGDMLPDIFYILFTTTLVLTLLTTVLYILERKSVGNPCIDESIHCLLKGKASGWFWLSQILGIVVPILLLATRSDDFTVLLWSGICTIIGSFIFRYSQLIAGYRVSPLI